MSALRKAVDVVDRIASFAPRLRSPLLSLVVNQAIKLTGTAGVRVVSLDQNRCVVRLENKRKVQNHIGGVHACGMALLAETATGLVVGINAQKQSTVVIKEMNVAFVKRAKGGMTAEAWLTPDQVHALTHTEKGEFHVQCIVTDDSGSHPITANMLWAWIPPRK